MDYQPDEAFARQCDAEDSLASLRDEFHLPAGRDGRPLVYFAGNSLGLQPRGVREALQGELEDWATLGVEAHFAGRTPWYSYHEVFRERGARLVGAKPGEVVMMNSLTVNLHLMMASFYRPQGRRFKVLMEYPAFPSDTYAVRSQIEHHGYNADTGIVAVAPASGKHLVSTEDFEAALEAHGQDIAVVLVGAVNYFTGQLYDLPRIVQAARRQGCVVGLDLAHAAGNVPLKLHAWEVDFAVWCSYKYLNSGPGAVAGCFVHQRHGADPSVGRLAGWWGNDPDRRFLMHLEPKFTPRGGADGWQISNPPILALAPVRVSLDLFDRAGMAALREKSQRLTGYLSFLIDRLSPRRFEVITPRDPAQRGCQLSILVHEAPRALQQALTAQGVVSDFREPNVVRVAPVPLYNTFHDVWRFAEVLTAHRG